MIIHSSFCHVYFLALLFLLLHIYIYIYTSKKYITCLQSQVWEFILSQEAINMVQKFSDCQQAVDRLLKESWDRWMKDSDNVGASERCLMTS